LLGTSTTFISKVLGIGMSISVSTLWRMAP
jgi:hypothetical protein